MDDKCCLICGKKLKRREDEPDRYWEARKYCSIECARLRYAKRRKEAPAEAKYCLHCGAKLDPDKFCKPDAYRRAKYCSRRCGYAGRSRSAKKQSPPKKKSVNRCDYYPRIIIGDEECLRNEKLSCKTCRHFERDAYAIIKDAWDMPEELTFNVV